VQPVDGDGGEQEGGGVDVEGQVDRAGAEVVEAGPSARDTRLSSAKTAAATGAEPYVAMRVSWLAPSSCSRGTRFGTDASLAGIQNRLTVSMRNDASSR
jgi:hypothetical protein